MPLAECQYDEFGPEGVSYTGVTSCITVTCLLTDGHHVGGHLSLTRMGGDGRPSASGLTPARVLELMINQMNGKPERQLARIHISGQSDVWREEYLNNPPIGGAAQATGEGESPYNAIMQKILDRVPQFKGFNKEKHVEFHRHNGPLTVILEMPDAAQARAAAGRRTESDSEDSEEGGDEKFLL